MINIKERVLKEAQYILNTRETIRTTAEKFKISKSTVHKDIQERLKNINEDIHNQIQKIMQNHLDTRHLIGGQSTKEKYDHLRRNKEWKEILSLYNSHLMEY